jgi:hypothetical protein
MHAMIACSNSTVQPTPRSLHVLQATILFTSEGSALRQVIRLHSELLQRSAATIRLHSELLQRTTASEQLLTESGRVRSLQESSLRENMLPRMREG